MKQLVLHFSFYDEKLLYLWLLSCYPKGRSSQTYKLNRTSELFPVVKLILFHVKYIPNFQC